MIQWFSPIGLILDIIGVLILFKYGLPSKIEKEPILGIGESSSDTIKREAKNLIIFRWAHIGLTLLILGFFFQLIGSFSGSSSSLTNVSPKTNCEIPHSK